MKFRSVLMLLFFLACAMGVRAQKSDYDVAIHLADSAYDFYFTGKKEQMENPSYYERARALYIVATKSDPGKSYPKERIKEINRKLDELEQDLYADKTYTRADSFFFHAGLSFQEKNYAEAKKYYLLSDSAQSSVKAREKAQLCSDVLQISNADSVKKFLDLIEKGDLALRMFLNAEATDGFDEKNLMIAQENYLKAIRINNQCFYAKAKLEEIDQYKKEHGPGLDQQYKELVSVGDKFFLNKDYQKAKDAYKKAFSIEPTEQYPKDRLKEIEKILAPTDKGGGALDKKFQDAIKKADDLFAANEFEDAKKAYQEALKIKPDEKYPKDMMAECDAIMKNYCQVNPINTQYRNAIRKADSLFKSKQYTQAVTNYMQALSVLPKEEYPKAQIEKCNFAMANEAKYKECIARADRLFAAKKYEDAKKAYQETLKIKAFDKYCEEQIKKIDLILEQ